MNTRRIAFLGAVLILLGAYLYFWDIAALHKDVRPGEEMLFPFRVEEVQRIEIRRQGSPRPLVLERRGRKWLISSPIEAPADPERVKGLLDVFKCGYIEVIGRMPLDSGQYGLDRPQSSISLTLGGKGRPRVKTVSFGSNNPGNTSCYAMVSDDPRVLLVGMLYKMELGKKADYYRLDRR